jgi:hypothetical protein
MVLALGVLALGLAWWSAHRVVGALAVALPIAVVAFFAVVRLGWLNISILGRPIDFSTLVGVAVAFTVFIPASFIVTSLIGGFRDAERRRKVGILWDVASFFPRWYHPLSPPSYGPYVVQKLTEELTSTPREVLSAHSQGAMISLVTLGQMEEGLPASFLTYGCQLGLHYPSHFPSVGIAELVEAVGARLGPKRWINLWRPNDPLGGPVGDPVLDRPVTEGAGHSRYEVTDAYGKARADLL